MVSGRYAFLTLAVLLAAVTGSLSACGLRGTSDSRQKTAVASQLTPTATPSFDLMGFQMRPLPACPLAELAALQVDTPRGDLLAWAPDRLDLAYLAPDNRVWGWYVGDVVVLSIGETLSEKATDKVWATGDLTWAPDGARLAFTAYRAEDGQHTLMTLLVADWTLSDWLPAQAAQTDAWSSSKAVVAWRSMRVLTYSTGCGQDCSRLIDLDVLTGEQTVLSEVRKSEDTGLQVATARPDIDPALYPPMIDPRVSPDGRRVLFSDAQGAAWAADLEQKTLSRLEIAVPVQEVKWSYDSSLVALRSNERITLLRFDCQP